jgi:predicted lipoprotein with Yx(FWY)xxD motif
MKKLLLTVSPFTITILLFFIAGCDNRSSDTNEDSDTTASADLDRNVIQPYVKLEVRSSEEYGEYLADDQGRSLYLFKADNKNESTCYDDCAEAWPPVLTGGKPEAGNNVKSSLVGTITRKDNKLQVTYNNWPLYYYKEDKGAGQTKGQDVKGFGAEWYLVTPDGEEVHGEDH